VIGQIVMGVYWLFSDWSDCIKLFCIVETNTVIGLPYFVIKFFILTFLLYFSQTVCGGC